MEYVFLVEITLIRNGIAAIAAIQELTVVNQNNTKRNST
jgi:hypothetical protein